MGEEIFGLDIDEPYNAEDVKQAILYWVLDTHQHMIKTKAKLNDMSDQQVEDYSIDQIEQIVRLQFQRQKYSFDNPTKESLFFVSLSLAGIAKSFENVDKISHDLLQILRLIDKLTS
ncbi:MAG: hypothetical protein R6V53_05485 [Candidatus Woesearchaeota archaeon]